MTHTFIYASTIYKRSTYLMRVYNLALCIYASLCRHTISAGPVIDLQHLAASASYIVVIDDHLKVSHIHPIHYYIFSITYVIAYSI